MNEKGLVLLFLICSYSIRCVNSIKGKDFYVKDLPLWPKNVSYIRMHAGHLPIGSEHSGSLFFWHFASKSPLDRLRTIIWLNGGPGCSSLIGAWMGIGPLRFQNPQTIVENNGSWHRLANLLFIDQPMGTGFSFVDQNFRVGNLTELTHQLYGFLRRYAQVFPEFLQNEIYFAGESFAGQYIPYIAKMIFDQWPQLKLRGLLIGSPYIDPISIYQSYLPYIVKHQLIKKDSEIYKGLANLIEQCQRSLAERMSLFADDCISTIDVILRVGAKNENYEINEDTRCVNMYDIRLTDSFASCGKNAFEDMKYITSFLHREDVLLQLHLNPNKSNWTTCSESVFDQFLETKFEPSIQLLPALLERIPIVLYNGEYDLVCNYMALENMLNSLRWNQRIGFSAKKTPWIIEGQSVGYFQTARNLTYILYDNAGHLVSYDYPQRTLVMLQQYFQRNLTSSNQFLSKENIENRYLKFIIIGIVLLSGILGGVLWLFIHFRRSSSSAASVIEQRTTFLNEEKATNTD